MEEFTENELKIGQLSYDEPIKEIKNAVEKYFQKEDIEFAVWEAIRDGMKSFFEENYENLIENVARESIDLFRSVNVTVQIKLDDAKTSRE